MRKQVIVIGLGRFGTAVARALYELGHEVLAVDKNPERLDDLVGHCTHVAQADGCDRAAMEELGVRNLDVAIVSMSANLEASILAVITMKDLGVPYVIARAANAIHATILDKIGVNKVVQAEQEAATTLAHTFTVPQALDYMPLGPSYGVAKIAPPGPFIGRTIQELELRQRYEVSLVALCRRSTILLYPRSDERIGADDYLVVIGRDDRLETIGR